MIINEKEIRKAISVLKPNNQLFEVRVIFSERLNYSGYFRTADAMLEAVNRDIHESPKSNCNVYFSLGQLNDACYDRSQKDKFMRNVKISTSDKDVIAYQWFLIDLDPKRPAGTSSTKEQLELAKQKAGKIYKYLTQIGFSKPLCGFSGNGYHLLYNVILQNSKENAEIIKKSLQALEMLFGDEDVSIDCSTFNPSRVCKLYGTMAQKGANSEERPHRMSFLLGDPIDIRPTGKKYFEKLAGMLPQSEAPQKYNNYMPQKFDVESWMSAHGLRYKKTDYSGGYRYILDCCPFDSSHKGKDAAVFQTADGRLGFHCFHDSCAGRGWKDVRMLLDPYAYERRQQDYEQQIYSKTNPTPKPVQPIEEEEGKPVFFTAQDLLNAPTVDERFIKTGIDEIDKRLRGLKLGYVSLMSGMRASGKSSIISEICLDAVNADQRVAVFSGELSPRNFMKWMNLQAAGRMHVQPTQYEGYYSVSLENRRKIAEWLDHKFFLYNNEYGNNFKQILQEFEKAIDEKQLNLLILDNLMAFDIRELAPRDKFDAQSQFVLSLCDLAKRKQVHILFIAHPRKAAGFLRLDDISGTADLSNAVDAAFIVHRVNNDFKRLTAQEYKWKDDNPLYQASNVIEIAKDRDGGTQDFFVPLYYEVETKRLKNSPAETKQYGWNLDKDGFAQLTDDELEVIPF